MSKGSQSKGKGRKKSENSPTTQKDRSPLNSETEEVVNRIQKLPPEKREAIYSQVFSGPIPPAAELKAYEQVVSGAADRIISMAEGEADHRRRQEEKLVNSSCGDSRLGLWLGFFMGLGSLFLSGLIALYANPVAGSILAFTSISSLVGVFVYGSRQRREMTKKNGESI